MVGSQWQVSERCRRTRIANIDNGLHKSVHLHDGINDDDCVDKDIHVVVLDSRRHRCVHLVEHHGVAWLGIDVQIHGDTCASHNLVQLQLTDL